MDVLVLAVIVLLWCCGGLLALGLCWASGRGDRAVIVLPEEREVALAGLGEPARELAA